MRLLVLAYRGFRDTARADSSRETLSGTGITLRLTFPYRPARNASSGWEQFFSSPCPFLAPLSASIGGPILRSKQERWSIFLGSTTKLGKDSLTT
jgi:hypothetical protein